MDRSRFDAGHRSGGASKLSRNTSACPRPTPPRRRGPLPEKASAAMLAVLGFATMAVLLLVTMTKRASVLVALILLPVLGALIGGFGRDLGEVFTCVLFPVVTTVTLRALDVRYFSIGVVSR